MNDHPNDSCEDPLLTKNPPPPPPSCSDMSHVLDAIRDLSTRVTNIDTRQTSHHSPTLDEPPLTPFPSDPTPHATQFFNRACHHLDPYDHYNNPNDHDRCPPALYDPYNLHNGCDQRLPDLNNHWNQI
ncbi:unnamed protein product [Spirodela intermedia]|uniref:Uncharacterized protein n=1 Tax=Spirodela intermedia TaxID=51605 RepID=A0A7I8LC05_SPIIN|nr:unnamed protein product [Spirodela intermedia]